MEQIETDTTREYGFIRVPAETHTAAVRLAGELSRQTGKDIKIGQVVAEALRFYGDHVTTTRPPEAVRS